MIDPGFVAANGSRPLLSLEHVTKRFPGVTALRAVSFELARGEVHALVGENGAGKSTLIGIIAGVVAPDSGTLRLEGQPIRLAHPVAARARGIVTVFQEAEVFGSLSVAENMAHARGLPHRLGWVRWCQVNAEAAGAAAALGEVIDIRAPASRLSVARRHMTQVAAALVQRARIVVLDEPTSALSAAESQWLFEQIERLKRAGVGIIYISHRQDEIFRLADRITVLRDGERVWHGVTGAIDREGLVRAMVGRSSPMGKGQACPDSDKVRGNPTGRVSLCVRGMSDPAARFHDVDLTARAGEIVGIYGLVGAGRTEWARALFGLAPHSAQSIEVDGRPVSIRGPGAAVAAGIGYLPEDRLHEGVCRGLSARVNLVLARLSQPGQGILTRGRAEVSLGREMARRLDVRLRSLEQPIGQLSGGNQQKVVLGRWLLTNPKVLILDEPTRGVDVAAKREIHRLIRGLADQGLAVVLISSELEEVIGHSDRVLVFRAGRIVADIEAASARAPDIARVALPQAPEETNARSPGQATTANPNRPRAEGKSWGSGAWRGELGLLAVIVALGVAIAVSTRGRFLEADSLVGVLQSATTRTLLALGSAAVIMAGAIDISIGSLVGLSAAAGGVVMTSGIEGSRAVTLGVLAALAVGLGGGLINAGLALAGNIHPIVVTLGTLTVYRGLMISLTGGNVLTDLPASFADFATGPILGVAGSVWVLAGAALGAQAFFGHTVPGRQGLAFGASPGAARLAGISQRRVWLVAFGLGGLAAGGAGLLELSLNRSMQSNLGEGYELRAISAAVIGGTAITGGRGSTLGICLGALMLTMVEKALVVWSVSQYQNELVIGGLLLSAILVDWWTRRSEAAPGACRGARST